jgi:hypothetical protein
MRSVEGSFDLTINFYSYSNYKLHILLRVQGPPPLVGLGEAQGFDFASNIQSEWVWGAASPPKVFPLILEQPLTGTTILFRPKGVFFLPA